LHQNKEIVDVVGQCMLIGGGPFGAIGSSLGRIARQEGFFQAPCRYISAARLDVFFPRILRVSIKVIITN
jgi:hypothetical protein